MSKRPDLAIKYIAKEVISSDCPQEISVTEDIGLKEITGLYIENFYVS